MQMNASARGMFAGAMATMSSASSTTKSSMIPKSRTCWSRLSTTIPSGHRDLARGEMETTHLSGPDSLDEERGPDHHRRSGHLQRHHRDTRRGAHEDGLRLHGIARAPTPLTSIKVSYPPSCRTRGLLHHDTQREFYKIIDTECDRLNPPDQRPAERVQNRAGRALDLNPKPVDLPALIERVVSVQKSYTNQAQSAHGHCR